jgi:hypothetical protein
MAYCTNAELSGITDTTLSTTTLDAIIAQADRRIKARIQKEGITPPASDDMLKAASLDLSQAGIITHNRLKEDLTDRNMAKSVKFGETTIQDDPDKAIEALTTLAWESVDAYIETQEETATTSVPTPRSTTSQ